MELLRIAACKGVHTASARRHMRGESCQKPVPIKYLGPHCSKPET